MFEKFDVLKTIIQVCVCSACLFGNKRGEGERKGWRNFCNAVLLCILAGVVYEYVHLIIIRKTGIDISELFVSFVKTGYEIFAGNIYFFLAFFPLLYWSEMYFGSDDAKVFRQPVGGWRLFLWRIAEIVILWLISRGFAFVMDHAGIWLSFLFEHVITDVDKLF